jgi:hypothetical protein
MSNEIPKTWGESDQALLPEEFRRPLDKIGQTFTVELIDRKGREKKYTTNFSLLCSNLNWRSLLSSEDLFKTLDQLALIFGKDRFEHWLDFPVLPEFGLADTFDSAKLSLLRHTRATLNDRSIDFDSLDKHLQHGSFLAVLKLTDDFVSTLDLVVTSRNYLEQSKELQTPEVLSEALTQANHYVLFEHGFSRDIEPFRNHLSTIIGLRLGLHEDGTQTLQSISDRFGITRERVRQIVQQWTRPDIQLSRVWTTPPIIQQLLNLLSMREFWDDAELNSLLIKEFQTQWKSPSKTISTILKMVQYEPTFDLFTETELVSVNDSRIKYNLPTKQEVRRAILQSSSMSGFALIDDVCQALSLNFYDIPQDVLKRVIRDEAIYGHLPLEYVFASGRKDQMSPVSRALLMLAWAGELSIDEIRIGLDRYGRFRKMPPPPPNEVLLAFYVLRPEFEVVGDRVRALIPTDRIEDTVEGQIALLCEQQDGAVISKTLIQDHFRQLGQYTSSASMYVTYSPILRPAGMGCITIVGRAPSSNQIEAARELASHLTIDSHMSWTSTTSNQTVEILVGTTFRDSGVISLPSQKVRWLEGRRLKVLSEERIEHGSLSVSGNFLYGFTPFFNAMRIDAGDTIQVEIDTKDEVALISVNPINSNH